MVIQYTTTEFNIRITPVSIILVGIIHAGSFWVEGFGLEFSAVPGHVRPFTHFMAFPSVQFMAFSALVWLRGVHGISV
jgi:hypothetical protein